MDWSRIHPKKCVDALNASNACFPVSELAIIAMSIFEGGSLSIDFGIISRNPFSRKTFLFIYWFMNVCSSIPSARILTFERVKVEIVATERRNRELHWRHFSPDIRIVFSTTTTGIGGNSE